MSVDEAIAPVPGWYTDPTGGPVLRWWSGAGWTDHVAPVPVPVPETPAPPASTGSSTIPMTRREARMAQATTGTTLDVTAPAIPHPAQFGAPSLQAVTGPTSEQQAAPTGMPTADGAEPPASNWWVPTAERTDLSEPAASTRQWRPVPQPMAGNTSAAWSLAFIPLAAFGFSFLYQFVAPMFGFEPRYSLGISIAALIVSFRVAKTDREELVSRGLPNAPHPAWVLLGVITYLAIRFYRISRAGGVKAGGPFWVALGSTIGQVALTVFTVIALLAVVAVQALTPSASDVSALLEDELVSAGYNVTVTCPDDGSYTAGSTFTCAVSDPNGAISSVDVSASSAGDQIYYQVIAAH